MNNKFVGDLELMALVELKLKEHLKEVSEQFLNEIMIEERKEFLEGYEKGENRGAGFNDRTLKLSFDMLLDLKVPKCRKDNKKLKFSVFKKYQRTTQEYEIKLENLYKTRTYEREINNLLGQSCLTQRRRESIRDKYVQKYKEFMKDMKFDYDLIKLDATEFNKRKTNNTYTIYFIWGFKKEGLKTVTKCLGYFVKEGKECKVHWEEVTKYIRQYIPSDIKLIISDMNNTLKALLDREFNDILKQNCLWHRLDSLCLRIDNVTKEERKDIFYKAYDVVKTARNKKQVRDKLAKFTKYEYKEIKEKSTGRVKKKDIQKMLGFYYNDNFNYFEDKELIQKYGTNLLMQNMDVESLNSQVKFSLRKYHTFNSVNVLIFRVYCFLEGKNLL